MTRKKKTPKKETMKRALFVRVGEDVLEALRTLTKRYRARNPGQRWSTADVVRSVVMSAAAEERSHNNEPKKPPKKARPRAKVLSESPKAPPTEEAWDQ